MKTLVFEDPGPKSTPRATKSEYDDAVQQLRQRPGEWALVGHHPGLGSHKRPFASRGCEVTSRKQKDGTHKFYARWPAW